MNKVLVHAGGYIHVTNEAVGLLWLGYYGRKETIKPNNKQYNKQQLNMQYVGRREAMTAWY